MPQLNGVVETALYVDDLARSGDWYARVLGVEELMADERMRAYGVADRHILLLFKKGGSTEPSEMPGGTIPPHDGEGRLHLAFAIDADQVAAWEQVLARQGVSVESKVICDGIGSAGGGTSLYFRDPDGHLVELLTPGCWKVY